MLPPLSWHQKPGPLLPDPSLPRLLHQVGASFLFIGSVNTKPHISELGLNSYHLGMSSCFSGVQSLWEQGAPLSGQWWPACGCVFWFLVLVHNLADVAFSSLTSQRETAIDRHCATCFQISGQTFLPRITGVERNQVDRLAKPPHGAVGKLRSRAGEVTCSRSRRE